MSEIVICQNSVIVAVCVYEFLHILTLALLIRYCADSWKLMVTNMAIAGILTLMTFTLMLQSLSGVCQ